MTETTPIEYLHAIVRVFPEFEEFWEKEGDAFREDDDSFTYHGLFAVFSHYVRACYSRMAEGEKETLFHFIEACMLASGEVGNAVHRCFIENLAGDLPRAKSEGTRSLRPRRRSSIMRREGSVAA